MEMYHVHTNEHNVEIDGIPFFAKEIKGKESFNRRELKRTKIKGGTEHVVRGEYVPREYTFTTTIDVPQDSPDAFDDLFIDLMNKPCEVICPDMGGMFNAQITINRTHEEASPDTIKLDVTVKEIPTSSLIPDDDITKPVTEILLTEDDIKAKYGEEDKS